MKKFALRLLAPITLIVLFLIDFHMNVSREMSRTFSDLSASVYSHFFDAKHRFTDDGGGNCSEIASTFLYEEYVAGRRAAVKKVPRDSVDYQSLKQFLATNQLGRKYDINTYVPVHIFSSANLKIDCRQSMVVAAYRGSENDSWIQISRELPDTGCPRVGR